MEEADVESARGRFSKRPCHKPGVSLSLRRFLFLSSPARVAPASARLYSCLTAQQACLGSIMTRITRAVNP